jgi:hypothetical protein
MTFVEVPVSNMHLFKRSPFMPNDINKGGFLSLGRSRYIVFNMMGGSSFSSGTYMIFKISLFIKGILHILIQVDIGGHPPIPLGPPPLLLSVFQFLHSLLFLAVFRVLNFLSRFEALNDVFWENGEQHGS